ncbi:WD40-repeat-containing domain protein [Dioszegia hungarica]|uniref:WD40-repeat-containing domain protein n=1 Tax=Dioszegia hungarica TaxID=4972 RepID=A0AA38H1Z3_9TREE|nr:WD40-repeat-containing domain protein [Dioszegia hungarica]KAI9632590.1 WD40-repeat-containing domain protein [Dioszegia hungarica]
MDRPVPTSSRQAGKDGGERVIEHESWELHTESAGDDGEDVQHGLSDIQESHRREIKHYRNLLIRAQSASAASIHELDGRLREAETRYDDLLRQHGECGKGKGKEVDVDTIREVMRTLDRSGRLEMLDMVLEGCLPSDISSQIGVLQRYKRSRFDILGNLGATIIPTVMEYLDVSDIVSLRQVSRAYHDITKSASIWRARCLVLEGSEALAWRVQAHRAEPSREIEWEDVYKRMLHREKNWRSAKPVCVQVLQGHLKHVVAVVLHHDTLFSGSMDGSIKVWRVPYLASTDQRTVNLIHTISTSPTRAISCLAFHPADKILVAGSSDGRVQIWQQVGKEWRSQHVLLGHTHGVRSVAIDGKRVVSAGQDKTIYIWDCRTGERLMRFPQAEYCLEVRIIGDTVLAIMMEGSISVFSVEERRMVAQHRLASLSSAVSEVGSGGSTRIPISWFGLDGRYMVCGNYDTCYRFEWRLPDPNRVEALPDTASRPSPVKPKLLSTPGAKPPSRSTTTPLPAQRVGSTPSATPTRSSTLPLLRPHLAKSTSSSLSSARTTPKRSMSGSDRLLSPTAPSSSSGSRHASRLSRSPSSIGLAAISPVTTSPGDSGSAEPEGLSPIPSLSVQTLPDFRIPPVLVCCHPVTSIEKGALGPKGRIVCSTRFAARKGAKREVGYDQHLFGEAGLEKMECVRLGGAWCAQAEELGLETPDKNPLTIAVDCEKFIYGCTDGSIVVASFG